MTTYTYSKTRQNLSTLLKKAQHDGKVLIKRRDGSLFSLQPVEPNASPLDVKGIKVKFSRKEVIDIIREVRHRD